MRAIGVQPRTLMGTAGPLLQRLRQRSGQATRAVQAILTPEQWALLRDSTHEASDARALTRRPREA